MLEALTLIEFIVAFLMGLAACCFLFWGIFSGAFENVEEIKDRILEIENDEP
ncbi:MAG: cbb3-type cytochrome oxidase assembly protein CcoS [Deltaproteobacteria bacterium]|nr:cbb3-type cytochrome oxidase assembly protein CcoS [Deltaproteobacteria bacterium]